MQAGWDESKVDVTERDFDCMTWQALRMPSIAKKAAVHAHAMNAALLGKEFVIPPAPGVSSHVSGLACDYLMCLLPGAHQPRAHMTAGLLLHRQLVA